METSENSLLALLLLNDLYCIFQKCIFSSYFILSFRHAAKKTGYSFVYPSSNVGCQIQISSIL